MHECGHSRECEAADAEILRMLLPFVPRPGRVAKLYVQWSQPDSTWTDSELHAHALARIDLYVAGPMCAAIYRCEAAGAPPAARSYLRAFFRTTAPGQPDIREAVAVAMERTHDHDAACELVDERIRLVARRYARSPGDRDALRRLCDRLEPFEVIDGATVYEAIAASNQEAIAALVATTTRAIAWGCACAPSLPPVPFVYDVLAA
jgi:hypothetical protein